MFKPLPDGSPWWAKWLVDNWSEIWKEVSTWFIAAIGFLAGGSEIFPQYLSGPILHYTMMACAIAALLSKFIKQRDLS